MEQQKGICPICNRPMFEGPSIDRHHFIPKSRGGKEMTLIHKICHSKIHSLFTEKELEREYYSPSLLQTHPDMIKYIKWVSKKDPRYYERSKTAKRKRK